MRIVWTQTAAYDLERLHAFLVPVSPNAAARVVRMLATAPELLLDHPRIGPPVPGRGDEVRKLVVGAYEMRYEIRGEVIYVIRIWHGRETLMMYEVL